MNELELEIINKCNKLEMVLWKNWKETLDVRFLNSMVYCQNIVISMLGLDDFADEELSDIV